MKRITLILSCFVASLGVNAQNHLEKLPLYKTISSTENSNEDGSNCDAIIESNDFEGGRQCSTDYNWTVANDIIVPANNDLTLNAILPSIGMNTGVSATSVLVTIYNNADGVPGNEIDSQTV